MRHAIRRGALSALLAVALAAPAAQAGESVLSLGARVLFSSWTGSNDGGGGDDFDARDNQLGLNATLQRGRWYAGLSLQGGEYDFDGTAPDQVFANAVVPSADTRLGRGEFDLAVGYFFWQRVSLFLDLKSSSTEWLDSDRKLNYSGLGLGVSGFVPIDGAWTFFGTLGVVPLRIEEAGGRQIGDGRGRGLELGLRYRVGERSSVSFSLKSQRQTYEFDNGIEQRHDIGGLMLGYHYALPL